jgi:hypothetical protein
MDGTITMSVDSMPSIERCTSKGTPLASRIGSATSPTTSTAKGALLARPIIAGPFSTS